MMCINLMEESNPQKISTTLSNFLKRCQVHEQSYFYSERRKEKKEERSEQTLTICNSLEGLEK